jgi:antitoxin component YwqK of YwqJK toxin-antitoxin module
MKVELNELDITLEGQVEIFYYHSHKYNGIIFEIFKGYTVSEFEVKDGMKNGFEKTYFDNGNIENCSEYKNGLLDGLTKNYYETGELKEEAIFEFGICISHKLYGMDGGMEEEYAINKDSSTYKILERFRKNDTGN